MQGAKRQPEVTKCAAISDSQTSQNADTPEGHKMRGDKRQPGVTTCGAIRDHRGSQHAGLNMAPRWPKMVPR